MDHIEHIFSLRQSYLKTYSTLQLLDSSVLNITPIKCFIQETLKNDTKFTELVTLHQFKQAVFSQLAGENVLTKNNKICKKL